MSGPPREPEGYRNYSKVPVVLLVLFGLLITIYSMPGLLLPQNKWTMLQYNYKNIVSKTEQRLTKRNCSNGNYTASCGFLTFRKAGRLGNQLFIYASSYGIAKKTNRTLILPPDFQLHRYFNISFPSSVWLNDPKSQLKKPKNVDFPISTGFMKDRFEDIKKECSNDSFIRVVGYIQSWKYFYEYFAELKTIMTFKQEIRNEAEKIVSAKIREFKIQLAGKECDSILLIGVHARRGDFLGKGSDKNPASRSFISRAISNFRAHFSKNLSSNTCPLFLGLGNSYEWNIKNFPNSTDIVLLKPKTPELDLCILSLCNHTISSVGSFSWWAGFMAGGRVTYMNNYAKDGTDFKNRRLVPGDYYLPDWVGL